MQHECLQTIKKTFFESQKNGNTLKDNNDYKNKRTTHFAFLPNGKMFLRIGSRLSLFFLNFAIKE